MIRHHCDGCLRRFALDVELEPFVCEACSHVLCPLCAEDGCCRAVRPGDAPCPSCVEGLVEVAGECMSCGGLGCYMENGAARECRVCAGECWLDVTLCDRCGGYGQFLVAQDSKQRRA